MRVSRLHEVQLPEYENDHCFTKQYGIGDSLIWAILGARAGGFFPFYSRVGGTTPALGAIASTRTKGSANEVRSNN
jgi:hypothetical protein